MFNITKVIKDIATLSNGEDYCLAGVCALIGLAILFAIITYVVAVVKPQDIDKICSFMNSITTYLSFLIGSSTLGKVATNKAEPQTGS